MHFAQIGVMALGCAALVACGPVYKTTYELTPPQTAEGRMCASQCQQIKSACQTTGYERYQRCRSDKLAYADHKYNEYRVQQLLLQKPIKKTRRSFYGGYSCGQERSYKKACESDFIGCFATCGGRVTPHTVCTANCEQAQPGHQISGGPTTPLMR